MGIIAEASMLSSHAAAPGIGRLETVFQALECLGAKHNSRLVLDPTRPDARLSMFKENQEWSKLHGKV